MTDAIAAMIARERLPDDYRDIVDEHWSALATQIARKAAGRTPLIVGINGAQATGKSTLCMVLEILLKKRGLKAVTLSLDDIYLSKGERVELAAQTHPLFATRGPPGTHTPGAAMQVIEDVLAGRPPSLPRFDKGADERAEPEHISGTVDVLLFEGWCVGAKPQDAAALAAPVNRLEEQEDPDGIWRGIANHWLREDYARLFGQMDLLIMLKVTDFDAVRRNRAHQESKLRASRPDAAAVMDDEQLERFMSHYERLTEHMLREMPARADIVIPIGPDQRPLSWQ